MAFPASKDEVATIKDLMRRNLSVAEIAAATGRSDTMIRSVLHGKQKGKHYKEREGGAPRHVATYFCRGCKKSVYLRPCQICAGLRYRAQEKMRGADGRI